MSLLFPAFLLGALTVAIPLMLHLSRRDRAKRVAFSAVRFLKQAPPMQARRRRLRELLLLALRVTALLLLALAFARPFVDTAGLSGRAVSVVALDTSYSMAGRFEAARAAAREAIAQIPRGHAVGVVTFADRASVASEPSRDRDRALAAVNRATPGFGATRYRHAVERASELIGTSEGRIVVITDLQRVGWGESVGPAVSPEIVLTVRDVGAAEENLAVISVEVTGDGVVGVLANAGRSERRVSVRVRVDGEVVVERETMVAPGSSEIRFDVTLPTEGLLAFEVDDPGGLPADDRRYRLLDLVSAIPVVVVADTSSGDPFYLERALVVGDAARLVDKRPLGSRELGDGTLREAAVVVLLGVELDRATRQRLRTFVVEGGGILIAGGAALDPRAVEDLLGTDPALSLGPAERVSVLGWSIMDLRHPLFQPFGDQAAAALGQVRFRRTMLMRPAGGQVLASFSDGAPALVEYRVGEGRAIVFASDLGNRWNDMPRLPVFVPFIHEVTRYLSGLRAREGHALVADAPRGVEPTPGLHTVPSTTRRVVLNVDPRESDLARMTPEAFGRQIGTADRLSGQRLSLAGDGFSKGGRELWWYVVVAMIGVLVAEAWLARTAA